MVKRTISITIEATSQELCDSTIQEILEEIKDISFNSEYAQCSIKEIPYKDNGLPIA